MEISELEFVIGFGAFIFFIVGIFFTLFLLTSYRRKIKYKQQLINLHHQKQQELLQTQIEIQEQTLQHVSRELHDNLGQIASLIKINLNTIQILKPDTALEKIESTKELIRQLNTDIKALSVSLSGDGIAKKGLYKAIEAEVDRLNRTGQFSATYELQGVMPDIDNDKAIILYRMTQEALNNIVKHSQAKIIKISLTANENSFILAIHDDGIGFNTEEKTNTSGAGLKNLSNRSLLINAQLHIQSSPDTGTRVIIQLPI